MVLIALTGWGQKSDVRSSIAAGFDLHLTKPVDASRLSAAIQEEAMGKRARQGTPAKPGTTAEPGQNQNS